MAYDDMLAMPTYAAQNPAASLATEFFSVVSVSDFGPLDSPRGI